MSNDFDVLIIGSGIGGLTCGAFCAKQGMRVAVCEKHFQIGGYAQNFSRKGFTFDSSIHSVSMAEHGYVCGLLTSLGVRDRIVINPNSCTMHVISPGLQYSIPSDINSLTERLCTDFPHEKNSIVAILSDMQTQFLAYKGNLTQGGFAKAAQAALSDIAGATRSYKEYVSSFIKDETLRHLFYAIWPFAGTAPSRAPIFNAFVFIAHALEGSHHVNGGFAKLADALAHVIEANGGQVKSSWPVHGIRLDGAKNVKALINENGDELTARFFVSNVSPAILHRSLLPADARNRLFLQRFQRLRPSFSAVCVYLGIDGDASDIVKDHVTFWFDSIDHEAIYQRILSGPTDTIDHLLVMRPPEAGLKSTLTLICFASPDALDNRQAMKKSMASAMIERAFGLFGDFSSRIRVVESASPATFERYTGNTGGALYGFDNARDLYSQLRFPLTTHIPNLFQVGHWTKLGSGVYNVMSSGNAVASMIFNEMK